MTSDAGREAARSQTMDCSRRRLLQRPLQPESATQTSAVLARGQRPGHNAPARRVNRCFCAIWSAKGVPVGDKIGGGVHKQSLSQFGVVHTMQGLQPKIGAIKEEIQKRGRLPANQVARISASG